MSGICGIINFDGAPVEKDLLARMAGAIAYRGPDGINYWIEGEVGLAHLALHTTPESRLERQPLVNRRGDLVLVADARVDNREELIRTLTAKGYLGDRGPTDADLILAAYECWREECPTFIIGDFSFAIWDRVNHQFFCARDPVGVRMLYYCAHGRTFLFATNIAAIRAHIASPPAINRPFLQDFLAGSYDRWVHETAFQSIFRLPPSYRLVNHAGQVTLNRYWVWGSGPEIHYKDENDYYVQFRGLLEQAIVDRLRAVGPVGITVSGGLDSSSIACMVDHLIKTQKLDVSGHIYSGVFYHTPTADEIEYIESVIERCSCLESTLIPCDDCWGLKAFGRDDGYPLDEPDISTDRALSLALLTPASQDGCRVVLTGLGADHILNSGSYHNLSTVADVSWRRLPAEAGFYRRIGRIPYWKLFAYKLYAGMPEETHALYQWIKNLPNKRQRDNGPFLEDLLPAPPLGSQSARLGYRQITFGFMSARLVLFDTLSSYLQLERGIPFLDRRIIDFVIKLPAKIHFRDGFTKYVLRRSMVGVLPDKVRDRSKTTHFSDLTIRGLCQEERNRVQVLLQDARIVEQGLVSKSSLVGDWPNVCQHNQVHYLRPLIRALCVEAWLRNL